MILGSKAGTEELGSTKICSLEASEKGLGAGGGTRQQTARTQLRRGGRPVKQTSPSSAGELAIELVGIESPPEKMRDPKFGFQYRK